MAPFSKDSQLSVRELADRHQRFWRQQSRLRDRRIVDDAIRDSATASMRSEEWRGVPIKNRKTLELALADAEKQQTHFQKEHPVMVGQAWFQNEFSRRGGQAPKGDVLNHLIQKLVREDQNITRTQLLHHLKRQAGQGTIVRITSDSELLVGDVRTIHFVGVDGKEKAAPVAGLKDRLSRVKAKIKSR
jgi:hypothetical protein